MSKRDRTAAANLLLKDRYHAALGPTRPVDVAMLTQELRFEVPTVAPCIQLRHLSTVNANAGKMYERMAVCERARPCGAGICERSESLSDGLSSRRNWRARPP